MHRIPGLDLEEMWDLSLLTLELIDTVRPATRLLQARAMDKFNRWIRRQLSVEASESLALLPKLRLWFLRAFGNDMFKRGEAMYLFRHL